jgi:inosine-uridine nucleoside N-ribohydrolase
VVREPATSRRSCISPIRRFEVLGITTVGDQWVREETQHVLRLVEIAERTDAGVISGAEYPLLNSKEETERWEGLYKDRVHGVLDGSICCGTVYGY